MKLRDLLVCGFCLAAGMLFATATNAADRRVALVVGNSAYKNASSLANTINDSTAIATLFKSVGFEVVISRTELGVVDFKRAVREFLLTAENADIAVVYYAGHGVEIDGTNYLVPVDAKLGRDYDVDDEAVALDRIIWALQSVKRLRLILLDACRDNPFPGKLRSAGIRSTMKGGLAKIEGGGADMAVRASRGRRPRLKKRASRRRRRRWPSWSRPRRSGQVRRSARHLPVRSVI